MRRRKPYAFGTQNEEEFKKNVKKNNNGTNGNGTGSKAARSKSDSTDVQPEDPKSLLNPTPRDTTGDAQRSKELNQMLKKFLEKNPR